MAIARLEPTGSLATDENRADCLAANAYRLHDRAEPNTTAKSRNDRPWQPDDVFPATASRLPADTLQHVLQARRLGIRPFGRYELLLMKDKEPPFIDLHPSQWESKVTPQPFLGENGKHALILFVLAFPISAIAGLLVTGELPYWLLPLLQ